jgi:hypothetical protein
MEAGPASRSRSECRLPESVKVGFRSFAMIGDRPRLALSIGGPTARCLRLRLGSLGIPCCGPSRTGELAFFGAQLTETFLRLLQCPSFLSLVVAARRLRLR